MKEERKLILLYIRGYLNIYKMKKWCSHLLFIILVLALSKNNNKMSLRQSEENHKSNYK